MWVIKRDEDGAIWSHDGNKLGHRTYFWAMPSIVGSSRPCRWSTEYACGLARTSLQAKFKKPLSVAIEAPDNVL